MTRFLDSTGNFHEGLLEDQTEMPAAACEAFEISADPIFKELHETALSTFCPHALVVPLERGYRPPPARDSAFDFLCQEEERAGRPLAQVSTGNACRPPTDNAEELERQIKSLALPP